MKISLVEDIKNWAYVNSRENEISQPLLSLLRKKETEINEQIAREYISRDKYMVAFPCIATILSNNDIEFHKGQQITRDILETIGMPRPKDSTGKGGGG